MSSFPSPALSCQAGRELAQTSLGAGPSPAAVNGTLAAAAVLGIAANVIPKKQKTLRQVAIGGSLVALAAGGLFFLLEK